jgi:TonB family protein
MREPRLAVRIGSVALTCLLLLAFTHGSRAEPASPQASPPAGNDELASIVRACVDKTGHLKSAAIARSSGFAEIDEAALKVARAAKFSPATKDGKPRRRSCVNFKVKFVIRDGEPVPAGETAQT